MHGWVLQLIDNANMEPRSAVAISVIIENTICQTLIFIVMVPPINRKEQTYKGDKVIFLLKKGNTTSVEIIMNIYYKCEFLK